MKTLTIILSTLAVILAVGFAGCTKKEQPAAPAKETTMKDMQMQMDKTAADANKTATTAAVTSVEQTTCPIMDGNKIDKNVFVEYKGKKVYFCCSMCKGTFEKDPEKYIAKLPQFAK